MERRVLSQLQTIIRLRAGDEAALKAVTQLYKEGLANLKAVAEKK